MRSRSGGFESNLMEYESPEHPPPITPRRSPPSEGEMPSLARATRMRLIAFSVTCKPPAAGPTPPAATCGGANCGCAAKAPSAGFDSMLTMFDIIASSLLRRPGSNGLGRLHVAVLLLPIANGRANRILGQHRTVNLHRRPRKILHAVGVLDAQRVVHGLALDPFGGQRRAGNRRAAAKGLELGLFDDLRLRVHADLQPHHVAALRRAHQAGADLRRCLVQLAIG